MRVSFAIDVIIVKHAYFFHFVKKPKSCNHDISGKHRKNVIYSLFVLLSSVLLSSMMSL